MIGMQRLAANTSANVLARVAFAGVIIGGSAVGLAAPAYAYPCDGMQSSMTPHQGTACQEPAFVAPPEEVAAPAEEVATPSPAEVNEAEPVGTEVGLQPGSSETASLDASPAMDGSAAEQQSEDPAMNPDFLLPQGDPGALEPNNGHH